MLVRRKPYHGETAVEILRQHVGAPLQLPAGLADFQPILDRLLAEKPNDHATTASLSWSKGRSRAPERRAARSEASD